ncbi:mRNA splicing protein [Yamadazyma tenuis]|uniref:Pre-mRNA-processing protein 45 n=1 Tax=Candida tenuis (strain ATCC 10573 / BCRC 21748 / CBS 615 / JCM 9827 / NBRC 10315 / NRRL Y-1498 / VKM Y-70) TaxID=590646 RepID=G3B9V9_CANTC|nr:uncharacterized protein CANTEDRAFT_99087 [Yamadazyma tenuis ATCC 10573]EGV61980.1 hypothetical protein CANTEDRAFT_99087 [Yamadazyma tenuis ATCC 10573]WEJ93231.1 mRNA splicing protein [Yamadazyma tenuis]
MFSSLLSRPKHSDYFQPIKLGSKKSNINTRVLVVPEKESQVQVVHNDNSNSHSTLSKFYLNKDGTLNYNMTIAAQASDHRFHSSYEDTIPLKKRFPNLKHSFPKQTLATCPDDSVQKCVEETELVIKQLISQQSGEDNKESTQYANVTSSDVLGEERGRERQIQIKNYQEDPMLPPKHKLRKNRHTEPSPPAPILKNTTGSEKLTKEEQAKWKIPAAVSNWKNSQGFTISLDKRMQASTSNETHSVNLSKLSELTSALDDAEKQAREDIKIRNELRKEMMAQQEKEKELKLKELAELTRNQNNKRRHYDYNDANKRSRY